MRSTVVEEDNTCCKLAACLEIDTTHKSVDAYMKELVIRDQRFAYVCTNGDWLTAEKKTWSGVTCITALAPSCWTSYCMLR